MEPESTEYVAFLDKHLPGLLALATVITRHAVEAEDLVQDTSLRLYQHWDKVGASRDAGAYARRVLMNEFLQQQRKRRVRLVQLHDGVESVDLSFQRVDAEDAAERLLARLPPRMRAAVALRYLEDREYPEIAEALRCRLGTARSLVARGLKALREIDELEAVKEG